MGERGRDREIGGEGGGGEGGGNVERSRKGGREGWKVRGKVGGWADHRCHKKWTYMFPDILSNEVSYWSRQLIIVITRPAHTTCKT